jgi:hypothetical protein
MTSSSARVIAHSIPAAAMRPNPVVGSRYTRTP